MGDGRLQGAGPEKCIRTQRHDVLGPKPKHGCVSRRSPGDKIADRGTLSWMGIKSHLPQAGVPGPAPEKGLPPSEGRRGCVKENISHDTY